MMRNELFGNKIHEYEQNQQQQQYGQQQQQLTTSINNNNNTMINEEEYRNGYTLASETINIGRETLHVTIQQGEQLSNAEQLSYDTQYTLDKATRLLRGMTWSGWLTNKFTTTNTSTNTDSSTSGSTSSSSIFRLLNNINNTTSKRVPPLVYDTDNTLPIITRNVTQALQNYHANINIYETCETYEQRITCQLICDKMYTIAHKELQSLQQLLQIQQSQDNSTNANNCNNLEKYLYNFAIDFKILRERQLSNQRQQQQPQTQPKHQDQSQGPNEITNNKQVLPSSSSTQTKQSSLFNEPQQRSQQKASVVADSVKQSSSSSSSTSSLSLSILKQQDEYLNNVTQSLGEINLIANSLNIELQNHNAIINKLDVQNDTILDTTRMVTRRTERIIQKSSWIPTKSIYVCTVSIQHIPTGMYLSIDPTCKSNLLLVSKSALQSPSSNSNTSSSARKDMVSFVLYKRQGSIIGLKNKDTSKYIGQSLFGNITCTSSTFDRREEIELDVATTGIPITDLMTSSLFSNTNNNNNDNHTVPKNCITNVRILLSSAGWGHGAYLLVDSINNNNNNTTSTNTLRIGSTSNINERKNADQWCITNLDI